MPETSLRVSRYERLVLKGQFKLVAMDFVSSLVHIVNDNIAPAPHQCVREIRDALVQELFSKLSLEEKFRLATQLERDQIQRALEQKFPGQISEDDMPIKVLQLVQALREREKRAGQNTTILFTRVACPANEPHIPVAWDMYVSKLMMLTGGDIVGTSDVRTFERRMALVNQLFPLLSLRDKQDMFEKTEYDDVRRELAAKFKTLSGKKLDDLTVQELAHIRLERLDRLVNRSSLQPPPPVTDNPDEWEPF